MTVVDAFASLRHYREHLDAIWRHLPADRRGTFYSFDGEAGLPPLRRRPADHTHRPIMVAAAADYDRVDPSPVVYVEHGAGQTYRGDPAAADHPAYSGGAAKDRAILFICPSETVADRWRERYDAPAVAVGSPKLDPWHTAALLADAGPPHPLPETAATTAGRVPDSGTRNPTVAVTFHWDLRWIPETRSAWPHYDHALPDLARFCTESGVTLLGHGHPKMWRELERRWKRLDVEPVRDLADVFDRADLLVVDNSSAAPEFASLGRPVLWLNAPWYRRRIDHGGRFWAWPRGQVIVDDPARLVDGVVWALEDYPAARAARERMVRAVYAHTDGRAGERAARAIARVLRG